MTPEERINQIKEHQEQLKKLGYSSLFTAGKLDSSHEYYAVHKGQAKYVSPTDLDYITAGITDAAARKMKQENISYHLGAMQEVIVRSFVERDEDGGDHKAMSHYFKLCFIAMANFLVTAQRESAEQDVAHVMRKIGAGDMVDEVMSRIPEEHREKGLEYLFSKIIKRRVAKAIGEAVEEVMED